MASTSSFSGRTSLEASLDSFENGLSLPTEDNPNLCLLAAPYRCTTVRTARHPSTTPGSPGSWPGGGIDDDDDDDGVLKRIEPLLEEPWDWDCLGAGGVGKIVERTAYGQYERCSFKISNCLTGREFPVVAAGAVSDKNAQSPTRRWQSMQTKHVESDFGLITNSIELGIVSARGRRGGRLGDGDNGIFGENVTEGARRRAGVAGVEGAMEVARDSDGSRLRSGGGGGGGGSDQPKRDTRMAVSEGSTEGAGSASGGGDCGIVDDGLNENVKSKFFTD